SPLAPVRTRHPRLSLHDALPISGFYELHVGQAFCALLVILVHRRDPASPFRQAGWRPAWWVTIALVAALSVSVFVLARDESKESKRMVRNFYGVLRESDEVAPNVVLLK